MVRQPATDPEGARAGARLLLARPDRPTAILCFSDAIAHTVLQVAEDLGIRVPAELSVAGFDDNPLATRLRPTLTTVRQDIEAKGRAAASALTAAITDARTGTPHTPRSIVFPVDLVVRESTAPPA
ncbi:hypothetical protein Asi03nite_26050 [Actinoplanes siamensis]|uniref:Transcriptional regulator LacI/GalR-like sensor domain-containing protein n=1 Tax=Actinoplanes siamensis TaxID=1223317 RepID=A0A919N653_9ACTN|nr:hypothetical protein Asi03nite_26050 [Actinoplanes siamensis]